MRHYLATLVALLAFIATPLLAHASAVTITWNTAVTCVNGANFYHAEATSSNVPYTTHGGWNWNMYQNGNYTMTNGTITSDPQLDDSYNTNTPSSSTFSLYVFPGDGSSGPYIGTVHLPQDYDYTNACPTPTPAPTPTPVATPTPSPTDQPTPTATPTAQPSQQTQATSTPVPGQNVTALAPTSTDTATPSLTTSPESTPTPVATPSLSPTGRQTPPLPSASSTPTLLIGALLAAVGIGSGAGAYLRRAKAIKEQA